MLKSSMTFGAIIGGALIAYTALMNAAGINDGPAAWLAYLILGAGLFIGSKRFRDKENYGTLSYGQGLGYGTLTALFSSIITGFFVYLFFAFMSPEKLNEMIDLMEAKMAESNPDMPPEQMEMAINMSKKFMTPGIMFIGTILSYTFFGFILSLVIAAFVKKDKDPFSDNTPIDTPPAK